MAIDILSKTEPETIRMVFQRLCEDNAHIHLMQGVHRGDFRVLAEAVDRLVLGMPSAVRERWALKPKTALTLHLQDRSLSYEGEVRYLGHGQLHETDTCLVTLPKSLKILDTHRQAEFVPDRPVPCPFVDQFGNVLDGHATAFGQEGLELAPPWTVRELKDVLGLNALSSVELRTIVGENLSLPVRVAYFRERTWGLRISDTIHQPALRLYRQWLLTALDQQDQRDRNRFLPGGLEAARPSPPREPAPPPAPARPQILVDRDPLVLVLATGKAFPNRLAEAIGRKFGVATLDAGPGLLKPGLKELGVDEHGWGRVRLVLVHHRLRPLSAMKRCHRLVEEEACPVPILVAGSDGDLQLKRSRALAAGAMEHLVVEPFNVLKVILALEEALRIAPPA